MSQARPHRDTPAPVFAALGSVTRLELLSRLSDGKGYSITELSDGIDVTRQATTKHLQVLVQAGIVNRRRVGRESRYTIQPESIARASHYLMHVSDQWDQAIARLQTKVSGPSK